MSPPKYEGRDLRDEYDAPDAPGMPDERLPPGWTRFDPDDGEAHGEEAYLFANGHQVLIGKADEGYFVLAYPEQGTGDLMGIVRPLAENSPEAVNSVAGDLTRARDLACGYMTAVTMYENKSLDFDVFERE